MIYLSILALAMAPLAFFNALRDRGRHEGLEMKVLLLRHTPDPDRICAAAAASCYSARGASLFQVVIRDSTRRISSNTASVARRPVSASIRSVTMTVNVVPMA